MGGDGMAHRISRAVEELTWKRKQPLGTRVHKLNGRNFLFVDSECVALLAWLLAAIW